MTALHVIIPAAGLGSRMGAGLPKLLLELAGSPIILRTVQKFLSIPDLKQIVVTVPEEYFQDYTLLLETVSPNITVIVGGATRKKSVSLALKKISEKLEDPNSDIVLVHDGARCFITEKVINKALEEVKIHSAVTVAVPVIDSIKRVGQNGFAIESLKRAELWAVQTPQAFTYALLEKAHRECNIEATDDASMVEAFHPVYIVEGDRTNIKVTTPFDLDVAKAILQS